jgi:histidinol dehydrogenase
VSRVGGELRLLRAGEQEFESYLERMDQREIQDSPRLEKQVRSILNDVRKRGDKALIHYTRVFDGIRIPVNKLQIRQEEIKEAYQKVPRVFLKTLQRAARRILRFHQLMTQESISASEKGSGLDEKSDLSRE